ncbi:MAG: hypothetical protein COB41_05580 [Proteobacteria bacterium]|nr:MAG: hypothetical protein COB41_05580 [Pseudomonadota bacterium]
MNDEDSLNFLQKKARDWASKVVDLHNTQVPQAFEKEKQSLLSAAKIIKNTIEKVTGNLHYLDPMDNLGIAPVVIGALGVSAAIAAITAWVYRYKTLLTKIEDRNRLMANGLTPTQASIVVATTEGGFSNAFLTGKFDFRPLLIISVALGGLWFATKKGAL